jgi:hypothetical protein
LRLQNWTRENGININIFYKYPKFLPGGLDGAAFENSLITKDCQKMSIFLGSKFDFLPSKMMLVF